MADGAPQLDESAIAAELKKRTTRDSTMLNRSLQALEDTDNVDEFMNSIGGMLEDAAGDLADDNTEQRQYKQTRRNGKRQKRAPHRREGRSSKSSSASQPQAEPVPYQPFTPDSEQDNPTLVTDPVFDEPAAANDDSTISDQEEQTPSPQETDQQRAKELSSERSQAKKNQTDRQKQLQAEAFAREYDIEAPAAYEQKVNGVRGKIVNEAENFGNALKKRIDEGDFKSYYLALFLAAIKDFADIPEQTGLITFFVFTFVSVPLYVIIKSEYGFAQRIIRKYMYRRIWIVLFAELIPVIKNVPMMIMFILSMHSKVKKAKNNNIAALSALKGKQKSLLKTSLFRNQKQQTSQRPQRRSRPRSNRIRRKSA